MSSITNGTRVEFINWRGEPTQDVVRGEVFQQTQLLEPYARNRRFSAVVLTEYSWIPVSDIVRVLAT